MEGYCGDVMKNGGAGVMVSGEKMYNTVVIGYMVMEV